MTIEAEPTAEQMKFFFPNVAQSAVQQSEDKITNPQKKYAQFLFRTKASHPDFTEVLEEEIETWSKRQASDFISKMRSQPDANLKAYQKVNRPDIKQGCYLLDIKGKTGTAEFWCKVRQTPKGTRFYRLRGAPGDYASSRIERMELINHLISAILADPEGAALRFAKEHIACMRCGSPLTDPVSRARWLGSDCAEKW